MKADSLSAIKKILIKKNSILFFPILLLLLLIQTESICGETGKKKIKQLDLKMKRAKQIEKCKSGVSEQRTAKPFIITSIERQKWVKNLKPIKFYAEKPYAFLKMNRYGYPEININSEKMPLLSSYFGYLHDTWGYTHKPKAFHDAYSKNLNGTGTLDMVQLPISINVPGNIDLSRARQISREILKKNPGAKFILRCHFFATLKFGKKFPSHETVFEDGSTAHWTNPPRIRKRQTRYSFASRAFERLCAEKVKILLERMKNEPYGKKVCGILFALGATGEFNSWYQYNHKKHSIDYSLPMKRRFSEFVYQKYNGDVRKLKNAWKDNNVDFKNITLPSLKEKGVDIPDSCNGIKSQIPGSLGYFRSPDFSGNQKVCDYFDCFNNEMSNRFTYLCEVAKKLTGGNFLTGGFPGGPLTIAGYHADGVTAFNNVMDSKWVDVIATPWTYEGKELGGSLFFRTPLQSLQRRGKNVWVECDTRTSLANQRQFGGPLDVEGDIQVLRRDLIRLVTAGAYGYWFEMKVGWYSDPKHIETMKQISEISKIATQLDLSRNSKIAVFYDEQSMYYMSEWLNFLLNARMIIQDFGYIGADYDVYSTNDIGKLSFDKYKLCIFANFAAVNSKMRKMVNNQLKKDGRTILWLYGCGLINQSLKENKTSQKNMEELTGFNIGIDSGHKSSKMKINKKNKTFPLLSKEKSFGIFVRPVASSHGATPESPYPLKPIELLPQFYVKGKDAKHIASFVDSGNTGFALRQFDDWTSVWFGSPAVSSEILREIAKNAGVHIYLETGDVVYHNNSFVGVHATSDGEKNIKLPKNNDVYDLFNNRLIGKDINKFTVKMKKHETALFYVGDIEILKKVKQNMLKQ